MIDPLSEVITQLQPRAVLAGKVISGAGRWGVRYGKYGHPSFCTVLEGRCRLSVEGQKPIVLETGDFVLMPATPGFTMTGFDPGKPVFVDPKDHTGALEVRHGRKDGPADVRLLGGRFTFESPDAALLVPLLPALVHARGDVRLATLANLVSEESRQRRLGRELVLGRLVEVMLIEALRASPSGEETSGLARALADPRLAAAIRELHADPARAWTVVQLAKKAALSRSTFFEHFTRAVGMPPMEYLLVWRMALAKGLLRRSDLPITQVAERVGYGSASTFSTAFSRHVGQPPGRYARDSGRLQMNDGL